MPKTAPDEPGSGARPEIDCGILTQLHQAHRKVASDVLPRVRRTLEGLLDRRTTGLDRLWLAHECVHFSPSYAFNRFLVLLVDEYCKRAVGPRLLSGRRLTGIIPVGHKCAADAVEDCLPHPHRPVHQPWHCLRSKRESAAALREAQTYDRIVVRHGVDSEAKRLSRQALPYELPVMP